MGNDAKTVNRISGVPTGLHSGHRTVIRHPFARSRRFALPAMAGAFGVYVAMHSPLRDAVAALLGLKSRACYFVCGDWTALSGADSAAACALIAAASLAAWVVSDSFAGAPYERPLVFGLSALAFIVVPAAAIGGIATWTGTALLRPPLGPLLSALPAAAVVGAGLRRGWRPHQPHVISGRHGRLVLLAGGLAASLLLVSTALSLLHPPGGGDAISYHAPLAVFLWHDGNLGAFLDRAPIAWALANPGTSELWYGLMRVAGGERLADLGQLPFAFLGGMAAGAFTRRSGLGRGAAGLAAGAFLLAPMVVMQSTTQANDVAGGGLLMATIALACAPGATWTAGRLGWLGLGLGLTATTKLALLPCVAGVTLFVIAATLWSARHHGKAHAVAKGFALAALMFLLVAAPWWIRNVARYGNPVYPAGVPLIGRGIFVSDFGRIDREFVPGPAAWPLYPVIEPHDDRSGFGMLFAVGVVPGLVLAARRGRRQPIFLYGLVAAFMLPAWWMLTMHEPRFLLAFFGLGCAFLPWSLLAVPRPQRRMGSALLAGAAVFSALVTFDQGLLPLARQPGARAEFYDRVWGVDPLVTSLPEHEGLLHHTGYGPPSSDYAAYYPLLGPSLSRVVIPADTEATTDSIVTGMRHAGLRYAYVSALPESRATVEAIYDGAQFQLVHMSSIERGEQSGARRYLYRPVANATGNGAIRRYLYRLK